MQKKPTTLLALDIVSLILLGVSTYLALVFAPLSHHGRSAARVLLPRGHRLVGMLGFAAAGISGIVYLRTGTFEMERVEIAAVEISLVFFFITIVLGPSGRAGLEHLVDLDPRLTTAAITELIYIAYFMLRQGIEDPDRQPRASALSTP